jgi:myosin heavy subunit
MSEVSQEQFEQLRRDHERLKERLETENKQLRTKVNQLQSERETLQERIAELEADREQLYRETETLQDRVAELETNNEQIQKESKKLQGRVEKLEEEPNIEIDTDQKKPISTLTIDGLPVGRRIAGSISEYDWEEELRPQLEADIKAECGTGDTVDSGSNTAETFDIAESNLEQVVALPDEIAKETLSPNQWRAREVAMNLDDYSRKTPKGRVMDTSDLRTVLSALFGISHNQTINRVREFFDKLGDDDVEVKEPSMAGYDPETAHQRRGKRLIVSDSLTRRLRRASESHDVVTKAEA